ncbi:MAG TPA: CCA tRNA nucleotidyltransferase [Spirochaetia bacterium]|nr:CCA tRNA nucleotidyltransferase [Spirochaetaceae bacterium]HPE87956.1 CCA tRNA nucleotidyltransferase [Spirochaetales bacterium]HRW23572.1 CCA tRNA nucleotidyltransferase [Spirochaetia bacterium]
MKRRLSVPKDLRDFAAVFSKAGYSCYFVGGAVRDGLLGRPVSDWDAATDARPDQVKGLFRSVIPTGIQHGTVTVRWRGASIETTTFRVDGEYRDGRRPESVAFTGDLLDDLSRRDFTINGMAVDPATGEVVDPAGGMADLAAGVVRAIGDPVARFTEDGLRPMRAVRFAARFGFSIDEATFAAIPATLERFRLVSAERVRDEFSKILTCDRPADGLRMLYDSGLLAEFLPELAACAGVGQGGPHRYDVLGHSFAACLAAPPDLELRLAALLHDVGKPARRAEAEDGSLSFHGHELESARLAAAALRRLKYPNAVVDAVSRLVRHHMFDYRDSWTDAAVRRFVARVGLEWVKPLALLRLADSGGMGAGPADPRSVMPLIDRVESLVAKDQAFGLKDLAIGGDDLAAAGWPRGPAMGRALAELLEAVLDDPELNEKGRLLDIAARIKGKYGVGD